MDNYIRQFIGPRRIRKTELSKEKTWFGKPVWEVRFDDGTVKDYPEQVIEQIATKKKTDLTELQKLRCQPVIKEVMGVLVDYDSKSPYPTAEKILEILAEADLNITDDIKFVMESISATVESTFVRVTNAVNKSIAEANKILWGMETYEKTMMGVHSILKKNARKLKSD